MKKISFLLVVFFSSFPVVAQSFFQPGKLWLDTDGNKIEAHGGGILETKNLYYWYGENHSLGFGNKTGISCYSSRDLLNWKSEGVVFPKDELPLMFQDSGACERPKVIYNELTKKYVMWVHLASRQHREADAGIAVSDHPAGPFKFIGHKRPIRYNYGYKGGSGRQWGKDPEEEIKGNTFRDMTLYKDDKEVAYVIYASEDNATLYIARLDKTYTDIEKPALLGVAWQRVLIGCFREAPAVFKYKGTYFMITSGTTGWNPNPSNYYTSPSMFGPWKLQGDLCKGKDSEVSFFSQPTYVLPVHAEKPGQFIYMGDRWDGKNLENSSYVWLPFEIGPENKIELRFYKRWKL